jgi:calcineurin-like phosphoesterase family protein
MLNFYKIHRHKDQRVFFWSDLHLCHEKDFILVPRGFSCAKIAKEALRNRWLKKITENDVVFLLGDSVVGAGNRGEEELTEFLHSVPFKEIYLMPGNHPSGFSALVDQAVYKGLSLNRDLIFGYNLTDNKRINLIPNYFEVSVEGQMIVMSHYPILSWNKAGKGSYMLFGHVHSNLEKVDWIKNNYLKGKCLDLGIESTPEPLEFAEIQKIMQNKDILKVDHH